MYAGTHAAAAAAAADADADTAAEAEEEEEELGGTVSIMLSLTASLGTEAT